MPEIPSPSCKTDCAGAKNCYFAKTLSIQARHGWPTATVYGKIVDHFHLSENISGTGASGVGQVIRESEYLKLETGGFFEGSPLGKP